MELQETIDHKRDREDKALQILYSRIVYNRMHVHEITDIFTNFTYELIVIIIEYLISLVPMLILTETLQGFLYGTCTSINIIIIKTRFTAFFKHRFISKQGAISWFLNAVVIIN